jgi:hypothetical protein
MKPWIRYVGGLGLTIDLAFHWSAAADPASPLGVLRTLFVDTDPGAPWWKVILGVAAHVMFFGVFVIMLISPPEQRERRKQNTPPTRTARAGSARSPRAPQDAELLLQEPIAALGPGPRAELLDVLRLPDHERAKRIGEFYRDPKTRPFAHLLIDLNKSPHARSVVLGELREELR